LPARGLFYRMKKLNGSVSEIVQELNQQLKESMPIGRFVAATLLCLDETTRRGEIWVGGTPQAFMFDRWGRITRTFPSENLALGIVDNAEMECRPVEFSWDKETQLLLCSDGLLEAANKDGAQFGVEGLAAAAANTSPSNRFQQIDAALVRHLDGSVATDDVSLMVIDCP